MLHLPAQTWLKKYLKEPSSQKRLTKSKLKAVIGLEIQRAAWQSDLSAHHPSSVVQHRGEYSDKTVKCQQKTFHAHEAIACFQSE